MGLRIPVTLVVVVSIAPTVGAAGLPGAVQDVLSGPGPGVGPKVPLGAGPLGNDPLGAGGPPVANPIPQDGSKNVQGCKVPGVLNYVTEGVGPEGPNHFEKNDPPVPFYGLVQDPTCGGTGSGQGPDGPDEGPRSLVLGDAGPMQSLGLREDTDRRDDLDGYRTASTPRHGELPFSPGLSLIVALIGLAVVVPLILLYRRLTRRDVLDNDVRRRALEFVEDDPGVTTADVARHLEIHYATARHHLEVLVDFDLVDRRRIGGQLHFYENHGEIPYPDQDTVAALNHDVRRKIAAILARRRQATPGGLIDHVDVARSTLSYHLNKLREAGVVDRCREQGEVRYRLRDRAREAVARVLAT